MVSIAVSEFVKRQTPESRFSHFEGEELDLIILVQHNWDKRKPGYRDGVTLVPVPSKHFYSGIVQLKAGDKFAGVYEARQEGEDPRKSTWVVGGKKIPAKQVDIILYRHDVLAENDEQSAETDWEIISINASPTEEEVPIPMGALIANHLELSGGTATKMTDAEFVTQLRKTVLWWGDKAMAGGDS
jgi:hypothetical protein